MYFIYLFYKNGHNYTTAKNVKILKELLRLLKTVTAFGIIIKKYGKGVFL